MNTTPRSLTLEELPEIYWEIIDLLDRDAAGYNGRKVTYVPMSGSSLSDGDWVGMDIYRSRNGRRVRLYNSMDDNAIHMVVLDHQSISLAEATFIRFPAGIITVAITSYIV